MSYLRPMGDGPITSPSQVDDSILIPEAEVGPSRVTCSELPADSPWRKPGQVCAVDFNLADMFSGLLNKLGAAFSSSPAAPSSPPSAVPAVALLVGGVAAAYMLLKKPKRRT
jgi:hypothetical protein